ncbi:TetR/AcrR family transcriptional regulator [Antrihabitans cavernicola]|uniref:TetR/AcrR family transcriptional regulator n=1 Tax=Antrihabitans cavernicola TaxID=2495913 RepID=A0A5A7SK08_9NOCA|nr:TetR/AcrR family transcriptional regulator [Spelaeibacter cavernicola]KAA0024993.1 TetR/AcrR family transcriptional regulator [Spelaeibacter cavernicola]
MTGTPRERARAQTMEDILRIGREHLAVHGAAAMSLRAVARDLGVVSSAVYRYVKSRDELLTLLVVDGYNELGDRVDHAVGTADAKDFAEQFRAIGRAVRKWAIAEPARYALLFGSPVPGYSAPAEQTTGPGTRVIVALMSLYQRAADADAIKLTDISTVPPSLSANFDTIREFYGLTTPDDLIARGVLAWAAMFGAVNFEVFGQYGPDTFSDPAALYEHNLNVLVETVGLG